MAPRRLQKRTSTKTQTFPPPSWEGNSNQNRSKTVLGAIQQVIIFCIAFWIDFEAIWRQLGSNLAAKALPKSTQVGSKIHQKWDQDADQIFA